MTSPRTTTLSSRVLLPGTLTSLEQFSSQVQMSREIFYQAAKNSSGELGETIVRHYADRVSRSDGKPLLGEYAPWLLCDILDIPDNGIIEKVLLPWMNLYAYTLFIDDVLDAKHGQSALDSKTTSASLLIASGLLLEQGLSSLYQRIPQIASLRELTSKYIVEIAEAALREVSSHRQVVTSYSSSDVEAIGNKVTLLKLCGACLLVGSLREADSSAVNGTLTDIDQALKPIDWLTGGIQLLDDVTDWREDWDLKSLSLPLTLTVERLAVLTTERSERVLELGEDEIFLAGILTGALEESITQAGQMLGKLALVSAPHSSGVTARFLAVLIEENARLVDQLAETRQYIGKRVAWRNPSLIALSNLLELPSVKSRLHQQQRNLEILAQHT